MWHLPYAVRRHRQRRTGKSVSPTRGGRGRAASGARLGGAGRLAAGLAAFGASLLALLAIGLAVRLRPTLAAADAITLVLPSPGASPTRLYDRTGAHLLCELASPRAREAYTLRLAAEGSHVAPSLAVKGMLAALGNPALAPGTPAVVAGARAFVADWQHQAALATRAADLIALDPHHADVFGSDRLAHTLLAASLGARYSPGDLLEWWINNQPFGRYAIGLDAAALAYFDRHAEALGPAELVALAALSRGAELSSSLADWKLARDGLAREMKGQGLLEEATASGILRAPLAVRAWPDPCGPYVSAFADLVIQALGREPGYAAPGYSVRTTLDYDLQLESLCAAQAHLLRLQAPQAQTDTRRLDSLPCEASRN